MRCPAGRPERSTRVVKSVSAVATGAITRAGWPEDCRLEYSTTTREGEVARAQTTARSAETSPEAAQSGRSSAFVKTRFHA